jgi:hypothetical protein
MDRDAKEFEDTAMGIKGQPSKNSYRITKPGDMKDIAAFLWKKDGVPFDSRNFAAGRKRLAEIATKNEVNLTRFEVVKMPTEDDMHRFENDVSLVSNSVRDGDIVVKS